MKHEREITGEIPMTISVQSTSLAELGEQPADPNRLGVEHAPLIIGRGTHSATTNEYVMFFDLPLGPAELRALLSGTAPQQRVGIYASDITEDFKTPHIMQNLYETFAFGTTPVGPGHDVADLEAFRAAALPVLTAERNLGTVEVGESFTVLTSLTAAENDIKNHGPYTPKALRGFLFTNDSPDYYERLLRQCSLTPKYSEDKNGNKVFNHGQQRSKIIERLMHKPHLLPEFIAGLPEDRREQFLASYALLVNGGYWRTDEDGTRTAVLGFGGAVQEVDPKEEVRFSFGNYAITASLDPAVMNGERTYIVTPREVQMRRYLRPMLHWTHDIRTNERQWNLTDPDASAVRTFSGGVYDEAEQRSNAILGLTTMAYMHPERVRKWRRETPNQDLLTPPFIPTLVTIHQTELLADPLLSRVEQFMKE